MIVFAWTDTAVAELRRLNADGLSASQVGKRLGCSRNAVIGKLHRIGIRSERPASRPRVIKTCPEPTTYVPPLHVSTYPPKPEGGRSGPPKTLIDLGRTDCRFPISGEGADTLFCCAWRPEGKTYCDAHAKVAFKRHLTPEQHARLEAAAAAMRAAKSMKPRRAA